jgi:hypothetical protein
MTPVPLHLAQGALVDGVSCDGRTLTNFRASASNALNPLGFFILEFLG